MKAFLNFFILCMLSLYDIGYSYKGEAHDCVHAVRKLAKQGDGSTYGSCMLCDPTYPSCSPGCQGIVNALYSKCKGVCLPDGYYFDPKSQYGGCFDHHSEEIRVGVERCGCNSASSMSLSIIAVIFSLIVGVVLMQ